MNPFTALVLFVIGAILILWGVSRLISGLVGVALAAGGSAFLLGLVTTGIHLETIVGGLSGALSGLPGVAIGAIVGAAIAVLFLGFGLIGLVGPVKIDVPPRSVALMLASPVPLFIFIIDGGLSRLEGLILVVFSLPLLGHIASISLDAPVFHESEVVEQEANEIKNNVIRHNHLLLLTAGILSVGVGGWFFSMGAIGLVEGFGVNDTILGMTLAAFILSLRIMAISRNQAKNSRPDLGVSSILSAVIFFMSFNAGIIALFSPIKIEPGVILFYFSFLGAALLLSSSLLLLRDEMGPAEGLSFIAFYGVYLILTFVS